MKKIISICFAIVFLAQSSFAVNLYVDEIYKYQYRTFKFRETDRLSNGFLFDGDQVRVGMNGNRYLKCNLFINQVKPNSYNVVTVTVDGMQVVRYDKFEQSIQPFQVWVDHRLKGDFHINFYSIDTYTNMPNKDVFIGLTDIKVFPSYEEFIK